MNKKLVFALIIGILCAGLVCLLVGIIVRFCVTGNAVALLVSVFTIIFGAIVAGVALLVLLILLLMSAITKSNK